MIDSSINTLYNSLKDISVSSHDNFTTRTRIRDSFYNYQMGHCYNPQVIYVQDSFTGFLVKREVPCGRCYYCRNNKINEWVTRCYAHLADFKNAYFITLTYAPYYNRSDSVAAFMLEYLQDALFFYDNNNDRKRLGYNPCVLCKRHYQDFFKRLRKNTGFDDITYVIAGEYGSVYGRPHFHAIIFTNHVLTLQDIKRAWSVALVHRPDGSVKRKTSDKCPYFWQCKDRKAQDYYFYQSIGRVDFNDLVNNGTLSNETIFIDGKPNNSHQCFAYVCKYCAKGTQNECRLSMAFNELKRIYKLYKDENAYVFKELALKGSVNEIDRVKRERELNERLYDSPLYLSSSEQLFTQVRPEVYLTSMSYPFYRPGPTLVISDPEETFDPTYPQTYYDFLSVYGCFMSPSRGCPIGSLYVKSHVKEMVEGNFSQPPLQTTGYVVPKYFLNKVDTYIYGLRKNNSRGNAQKGNLKTMSRLFDCNDTSMSIKDFATNHHQSSSLAQLLNSSFAFVDKYTGERMLIFDRCYNGVLTYRVNSYKYDRSQRKYIFLRSMSLDAFIAKYSLQLTEYYVRHQSKEYNQNKNSMLKIRCESILNQFTDILDIPTVELHDTINQLSESQLQVLLDMNTHMTTFERFCSESIVRLENNVREHNQHLKFHKHKDNE